RGGRGAEPTRQRLARRLVRLLLDVLGGQVHRTGGDDGDRRTRPKQFAHERSLLLQWDVTLRPAAASKDTAAALQSGERAAYSEGRRAVPEQLPPENPNRGGSRLSV